jgi:hypothetical protein
LQGLSHDVHSLAIDLDWSLPILSKTEIAEIQSILSNHDDVGAQEGDYEYDYLYEDQDSGFDREYPEISDDEVHKTRKTTFSVN